MLAHSCRDVDARAASAEEVPLDDAFVDAVFAAEAFHWFDGLAVVLAAPARDPLDAAAATL